VTGPDKTPAHGADQQMERPTVSTAPARPGRFSAIPSHLGRARTSTVVLGLLFVAIFALYLTIKPADPVTTSTTTTTETGTEQPAPAPTTTAPETPAEPTTSAPGTTSAPTTSAEPTTAPEETTVPQETTEAPLPTVPAPTSRAGTPTTGTPTG
jgi:cytoskeletal protein RodZ